MQNIESTNTSLNSNTHLHGIPRPLLVVFVSMIPLCATLLLFSWLQADLKQFLPLGWNDQTWMWHQVLTFREAGFNGGYYVVNEIPAAAQFVHFSSWGPVYPIVLGTIAKLIGWEPYTGILFNLILLTITICVFLILMPFDRKQIVLTGLIMLTLSPVLIYLPTISQETVHQSAAFVVAGIFYLLLTRQKPHRHMLWAAILLLTVLSVLRFSWVIFFVPLFLVGSPHSGKGGVLLALFKAALIAAIIYSVIGYISAPGGNFLFAILGALSSAPLKAIGNLILLLAENIYRFIFPFDDQHVITADFVQAIQFVMLLGVLIAAWSRRGRVSRQPSAVSRRADMVFHLYNLIIIFVLALLFYRWNGYYRIFAVHLLVTLLILIGYKQYRLVITFILIGLIGLPIFLNQYQRQHAILFHQDAITSQLDSARDIFQQQMVYEAEASNAWCNTVLVPTQFLDYHVLAVPAKIGISFLWFGDVNFPLKSHYLLFDETTYQEMRDRLHVEPLAVVSDATLYRNLDSGCVDG